MKRQSAAPDAQRDLLRAIDDAFRAAGKDPHRLTPVDLAPLDEFHIGGRRATAEFAAGFAGADRDRWRGRHLLDIGCGLGGAARYFAATFGCRVTGVDLRGAFVAAAAALSRRHAAGALITCLAASATAMPFAAGTFDAAYMLHVGMNVADKALLLAEVRRVLRPGAVLGIYDVMRTGAGDLAYPLPWATDAGQSFVESPGQYRAQLASNGFRLLAEHDRAPAAREFFRRARQRAGETGAPPIGLHLVMGAGPTTRAANVAALIERGILAPTEMFARAE